MELAPIYILLLALGGILVIVFVMCLIFVRRVPFLNLKGKTVLLTGGSEGIGLAVAKELIMKGAIVCIAARREDVLKAAVAKLNRVAGGEHAGRAHYVQMDVSSEDAVTVAAAEVKEWVKSLNLPASSSNGARTTDSLLVNVSNNSPDLVICNAGYSYPARFLDTPSSHAHGQMNVNFFGCVNVTRAFLGDMIQRKSGRVVLVSSMAGGCPLAGFSTYGPSKAAVRALAVSLDMENAVHGVRFQVVNPPDVATPGYEEENKIKSEECKRICAMGGASPFTSEQTAKKIVSNIERYSFQINIGFDGVLLGMLTATSEPATSTFGLFGQVLFGGWLRLIMATYSFFHYRIVNAVWAEEAKKRR